MPEANNDESSGAPAAFEKSDDDAQKAAAEARVAELAKRVASEKQTSKQAPSMGRIVIFRDASGNCAPAIVTRVYEDGSLALHAFRDDAAGGPTFDTHGEVKEDSKDSGWFWPPRV